MNAAFLWSPRSGRPGPGIKRVALVLFLSLLWPMISRASLRPPPDAAQHWAFQPPRSTAPPAVKNTRWPRTDVDRFILARLEAAGLTPAPAADARTLIRRMSFDLLGLPPSPEETEVFARALTADPEGAIARLIDRLLASPRYGERWGRHWLDVARYSDTKGYVYDREERRFVHSFAYRDWVIRAFNEDLPYDRFLLLQMAADQLVPAGSPDLAAMGFITGGRRFIGVTHDIIDDRIDVVTRGTLALTVQCARCHDHKFDPIPIQDYYSLYGVFRACDDRLIPLQPVEDAELARRQKKFTEKMAQRRAEANERLRQRVADYLTAQLEMEKYPEEGFDQILGAEDLIPASVRSWRDYLRTVKSSSHPIFGPWFALADLPKPEFEARAPATLARVLQNEKLNPLVAAAFATPPRTMRDVAARYGELFATAERQTNAPPPGAAELRAFLRDSRSPTVVPDTGIINNEWFFPTSHADELAKLQGDVERRLIELGTPAALYLTDRAAQPNPRVFLRGSPARPGEEVPRQFLGVLAGSERKPFAHGSGRLELARAIASAGNPLTARVMVNRIWQHHFGTGLVRTPSDFGLRAEPPSHPELLDWLAARFIAEGWSVKAMHRLILSSAVYQQASATRAPATGEATFGANRRAPQTDAPAVDSPPKDPDNRLLARFPIRRLEFEALRDAMLAASGELDLTMGGKPVELLDAGNKRRTVYALVDRQFLPGTFRTFDFANPDIHVAVRHETTVPQQALFFLNGTFAAERARALAGRFTGEPPERRVQRLHQTLYQRDATHEEVSAALRFIRAASTDPAPVPPPVRQTQWRYGIGEYDATAKKLKSFTPLPHFTGSAWQGAASWPGGDTGWAQLTAEGGHPGNTLAHACVRRWVAPFDAMVTITGTLKHEPEQGDGVRGFIFSSRDGELKAATVHKTKAVMTATNVVVKTGDTIDFIVDIGGVLNSDQFLWAPVITTEGMQWDARADFDGPRPAPRYLTPWEQYAQVLLLANEFAFVD
ncbi:MAG TPA: DUF1549 and DUF1553 domain-containing protein [Methylomirabilota bacterium]|nr:DUF1549 and DUF1553 domain-containing protein [Methylomirabilota bacterium]